MTFKILAPTLLIGICYMSMISWAGDYAGIKLGFDEAMTSEYELPNITNKEMAEKFARETRFVPVIFDMMLEKYVHLYNEHNSMADYYWDAITIMEGYRRLNIRGDNSMITKMPWFDSRGEAIKFAQKYLWTEFILQLAIRHLNELAHEGYSRDHGWLLSGQSSMNNIYYEQYYRVELAVKIMAKYKLHGIKSKDDAMVGSVFYIGSEPIKGWH